MVRPCRAGRKPRVDHVSGPDIRDCFLSLMEPDRNRIRFASAPGAAISASKKRSNDRGICRGLLKGAFEQFGACIENDHPIADAVEESKKMFHYQKVRFRAALV
jgi:hypothetical protein